MKKQNYINYGYFINEIYKYQQEFPEVLTKEELYKNLSNNCFNKNGKKIISDYGDWKYFTPMVTEIFMNNLEEVKNLVESGYDFNEDVKDGLTPLMIATYLDRKEIINYLYSLDKSIVNKKDNFGRDLLKFACKIKNIDFINQIMPDVDINSVDINGYNAMHYNLSTSMDLTHLNLLEDTAPGMVEASFFEQKKLSLNEFMTETYQVCELLVSNNIDLSGVNPLSRINFCLPYKYLDKTIDLLLKNGASRTINSNEYSHFEEMEYSFEKLLQDIKDFDISEWIEFPFLLSVFKKFEHLVKKYSLTVIDEEVKYSHTKEKTLTKSKTIYEDGFRKK